MRKNINEIEPDTLFICYDADMCEEFVAVIQKNSNTGIEEHEYFVAFHGHKTDYTDEELGEMDEVVTDSEECALHGIAL